MSDNEELAALSSARECAGWNGPPTVDVWCVDPCLTRSFDEIYFENLDEAIGYIADNFADYMGWFDEDEIAEGKSVRIHRKQISQSHYEAIFLHGEAMDADKD